MKFLVDENLGASTVKLLREMGHEVLWVPESKLMGIKDKKLFQMLQQKGMVLITKDVGFGNIFTYRPKPPAGIIVCRIKDERPGWIDTRLKQLLEVLPAKDFQGKLIILEDKRYRIRGFGK